MISNQEDRPINIIRLHNMLHLIRMSDARFDNEFCRKIGIQPGQLSQIKDRRKNIGHEIASKIEKAFRLPHGWMDERHSEINYPGVIPAKDGDHVEVEDQVDIVTTMSALDELPEVLKVSLKKIIIETRNIIATQQKKPRTQKPITMRFEDEQCTEVSKGIDKEQKRVG